MLSIQDLCARIGLHLSVLNYMFSTCYKNITKRAIILLQNNKSIYIVSQVSKVRFKARRNVNCSKKLEFKKKQSLDCFHPPKDDTSPTTKTLCSE